MTDPIPDAQPARPLLVFDGDCGFCRWWIARWRQTTGDQVEYRPWAEVADRFPADEPPPLAFDHAKILEYARHRLRNKLEYTTVGFQLPPRKFTLTELQRVYEIILDKEIDKRNFRRKIALLDILEELEEHKMDGVHRPARLHRFKARKFEKLKDKGILFPF